MFGGKQFGNPPNITHIIIRQNRGREYHERNFQICVSRRVSCARRAFGLRRACIMVSVFQHLRLALLVASLRAVRVICSPETRGVGFSCGVFLPSARPARRANAVAEVRSLRSLRRALRAHRFAPIDSTAHRKIIATARASFRASMRSFRQCSLPC